MHPWEALELPKIPQWIMDVLYGWHWKGLAELFLYEGLCIYTNACREDAALTLQL